MRTKANLILAILAVGATLFAAQTTLAQTSNTAKARALVDAAIKMTDSDKAVKLLWQATDIDPALEDPYVYLGIYYNSRSDFTDLIKVYQKLAKYQPNLTTAYRNIP